MFVVHNVTGTPTHEYTSHTSREFVFQYFNDKYRERTTEPDSRPGDEQQAQSPPSPSSPSPQPAAAESTEHQNSPPSSPQSTSTNSQL